jgi:hypothetical protein
MAVKRKGSGPMDRKYLSKLYAFKARMDKGRKRGK